MHPTLLEELLLNRFDGLNRNFFFSEITFYYNPKNTFIRGIYFATIKLKDGPNDKASKLNRNNIYRFSFNPGLENYINLFGDVPKRPKKGRVVTLKYDFTKVDTLLPHPVYAWMGWVNVLSPSEKSISELSYLLDIAYASTVEKFNKKLKAF